MNKDYERVCLCSNCKKRYKKFDPATLKDAFTGITLEVENFGTTMNAISNRIAEALDRQEMINRQAFANDTFRRRVMGEAFMAPAGTPAPTYNLGGWNRIGTVGVA